MRVALAQLNPCVADLEGNVRRCLDLIDAARRQDATLIVLPEMAVPGSPPRDILFDSTFVEAVGEATADLAHRARYGPPVIAGSLVRADRKPPGHPGLLNAALLLWGGEARLIAAKRLLPACDVFFEPRWFVPGPALPPIDIGGRRLGALLGEDLYDEGYDVHPAADLIAHGADVLVCLAASPYRRGAWPLRLDRARRHRSPLIYVNLCGGQDELIFEGGSFALSGEGALISCLPSFNQGLAVVDLDRDRAVEPPDDHAVRELFEALVTGVRDFALKNRLERAFVSMSGGIDSSVVAVIAAEALGPDRVTGIAIPSRYTDPRSTACARQLADALRIHFHVVELEEMHRAAEATLGPDIAAGTTAENIQARLRAVIMMSFVNHQGGMLLNASNKTELALGYGTLYGDMAGTLCPIGDLTKPEVVALAGWIDATRRAIPRFVLERPPSAELRPEQVDPFDYAEVSPLMERLVLDNRSDAALRRSEHKRWQMGVILKVSDKSFGTGRLIPITRR